LDAEAVIFILIIQHAGYYGNKAALTSKFNSESRQGGGALLGIDCKHIIDIEKGPQ
jgi:hypothetical protein